MDKRPHEFNYELGTRIRKLGLSTNALSNFGKYTSLSNERIKEIETKFSNDFLRYLFGYFVFLFFVEFLIFFSGLSLARALIFIALVGSCLTTGVSVLLDGDRIKKLDQKVHEYLRLSKDSMVYFFFKAFMLSDRSTKDVQVRYACYTNLFLVFGVFLLTRLVRRSGELGLFEVFGYTSESLNRIVYSIADALTLSFGSPNGWNIFLMILYILISLVHFALLLNGEERVVAKGEYDKYIASANIYNGILLIVYVLISYGIIMKINSSPLTPSKTNLVTYMAYWPVIFIGVQNYFVVLLHQRMTKLGLAQRTTGLYYVLLIFILSPYFLIAVIGLQLIPGVFVLIFLSFLLLLYWIVKVLLKAPSYVRFMGFLLSISLLLFRFFMSE